MKATELRIGNLVYYHIKDKMDEKVEWDEINHIDVDDLRILTDFENNSEYKPIPLTEEWLLKFGFEKVGKTIFLIGNFKITLKDKVFSFYTYHYKINLKSIHELQNLYFVLTGQELTI